MEKSEIVSVEEVQEFHDFLMGKDLKDDINPPLKLTAVEAMRVIDHLQCQMKIIPPNYEMCSECNQIFDRYWQGCYLDEDEMEYFDPDYEYIPLWPTHQFYCSDECLYEEIDRQRGILFRSFSNLRYRLKHMEF